MTAERRAHPTRKAWLSPLPAGIDLRREVAGDRPFACTLYAANQRKQSQRSRSLRLQFDTQSRNLADVWPGADRFTVVAGDRRVPIGRLYVSRAPLVWHLIEIGLLPGWQRRGIGAALVAAVQQAAATSGAQMLDLEVARENTGAAALYARLGFFDVATRSATHRAMALHI